MSAKVLKQTRLTPRDLASGGLLVGRILRREKRSYVTGEQVRYEGEFTFYPPTGLPITADRLLLPSRLEIPGYPMPDEWTFGDFAGIIDTADGAMRWASHNCSPLAVDLPANIALALLPTAAITRGLAL